jgi:hypothetical protein
LAGAFFATAFFAGAFFAAFFAAIATLLVKVGKTKMNNSRAR